MNEWMRTSAMLGTYALRPTLTDQGAMPKIIVGAIPKIIVLNWVEDYQRECTQAWETLLNIGMERYSSVY